MLATCSLAVLGQAREAPIPLGLRIPPILLVILCLSYHDCLVSPWKGFQTSPGRPTLFLRVLGAILVLAFSSLEVSKVGTGSLASPQLLCQSDPCLCQNHHSHGPVSYMELLGFRSHPTNYKNTDPSQTGIVN